MLNMKAMLLYERVSRISTLCRAGHARDHRSAAHGQGIKNSPEIFEGNPPKLN